MGKYIRKYNGAGHIVTFARNQPWYGKSVFVREHPVDEYQVFYVSPDNASMGYYFDETTKYNVDAQYNGNGQISVNVSFDAINDYLIDNNFYIGVETNVKGNICMDRGYMIHSGKSIKDIINNNNQYTFFVSPHNRVYKYLEHAKIMYDNHNSDTLPDDWRMTFGVRVCFFSKSYISDWQYHVVRHNELIMKNFIHDYKYFTYLYGDVK